jgi:hypothetical protein
MSIEIKTGIKCEYICLKCEHKYSEQRDITESAFFTTCNNFNCNEEYNLVSQTEYTYEVVIPDPVVEEAPEEEPTE